MNEGSQFILSTIGHLSGVCPLKYALNTCHFGQLQFCAAHFSQGTEDNIHFTQTAKQLTDDNDFMSQVTQRWRSPYLITQPLSCPVIPSTFCQAHTFMCGKKVFNHVHYFSPFAGSFLQDGKPLRLFRTEIPYLEGYFHQLVKLEASITTPNHTEL